MTDANGSSVADVPASRQDGVVAMQIDDETLAYSLESLRSAAEPGEDEAASMASQLATVIAAARDVLGVDSVGLTLLDEWDRLRGVASSDPMAAALESAQARIGAGPGIDAISSGQTIAVDDLIEVEGYVELAQGVAATGIRAVLAAPVRVSDDVVGDLATIRTRRHRWSQSEIEATQTFAELIGELLSLLGEG